MSPRKISLIVLLLMTASIWAACSSGGDDDASDDDDSAEDDVSADDDTAAQDDDSAADDADDSVDDDSTDDDTSDDDDTADDDECGDLHPLSEWPTSGYLLRMSALGQIFHVWVTSVDGTAHIETWLASKADPQDLGIPGADIELNSEFNPGYSYRMKPGEVIFGDFWIEVCDATPCYVELDPEGWFVSPKTWCPWAAWVLLVWDCDGGDGASCGDPVYSGISG